MKPDHEAIATRAYFLWLEAGKPEGRSLHFWLLAESQCLYDENRSRVRIFYPHKPVIL